VDTEHHLIVTHEVTNTGSDRSQLANVASQAKGVLGADHLDVVADRGYFNSTEILACEQADITVTLPKPMTSGAKSDGRFGKQDFGLSGPRPPGRVSKEKNSILGTTHRATRASPGHSSGRLFVPEPAVRGRGFSLRAVIPVNQ
jgi:hypothetical protein